MTGASIPGHRPPMFYAPRLEGAGTAVTLEGDEARHALASRRLRAGDSLALFNGEGTVADAVIVDLDRRGQRLRARLEAVEQAPDPVAITLAAALPKGERAGVMLDMATQLGMTRFLPLTCERGVVKANADTSRWKRICLEACKQSRRPWLPEIVSTAAPADAAARCAGEGTVWLADPDGEPVAREVASWRGSEAISFFVGPEGGFTEAEIAQIADAGGRRVSLGKGILRVETAAVAGLSLLNSAL